MKNILLASSQAQVSSGQPIAPDDIALLAALRRRGITAGVAAWDDLSVEWARADLVVIRSVWDYHLRPQRFLQWAEGVAQRSVLYNPLQVVRWNAHKGYLRKLEHQGIPIIPTRWLAAGAPADLAAIMQQQHWHHVILKPAVGVNAYGALAVDCEHLVEGQAHLHTWLSTHDMLVQPYLPTIAQLGEHSLFWIAGQLGTYAVCKRTMTRSAGTASGDEAILEAQSDELQLAQRVVRLALKTLRMRAKHLLFARIDLARDALGRLCLMELELIEPRLYFDLAPHLADRLAEALVQSLSQTQASFAQVS